VVVIEYGIINGKLRADEIQSALTKAIEEVKLPVKLAIILVGDDPASAIYVRNKVRAAEKVGIIPELYHFKEDISEQEVLEKIDMLNRDEEISGLIVQLPLPGHIDKTTISGRIAREKDVDGLNPVNVGLLYSAYSADVLVPCTALGCLDLIQNVVKHDTNSPSLSGKNAVIIGRSNIVGRPLAALLLQNNCTVTICHSKSVNVQEIAKRADIVVTAIGHAHFFTKEYFKEDAIVIDVGINRIEVDNKTLLVGDVDFQNVKDHVKYITQVPGGVGPMTIAYLLVNSFKAMLGQKNIIYKGYF